MNLSLTSLALSGYRSFGSKPQYLPVLSKINLFIGQNNSGKSNLLRFLVDAYPKAGSPPGFTFQSLDKHLDGRPETCAGMLVPFEVGSDGVARCLMNHPAVQLPHAATAIDVIRRVIGQILKRKAELDGTSQAWHVGELPSMTDRSANWKAAARSVPQHDLYSAWSVLTQQTNGDREAHWEPQILKYAQPQYTTISAYLVPATREIRDSTDPSESLGGTGLIQRLAQLQNPRLDELEDRKRFEEVRDFVRYVTNSSDAEIEVPHDRKTLLVHMGGRSLPIERLGTGIHEVVILAAAASILQDSVVCIEEPELHLNPLLQRKLMRYLSEKTTNQYFIATHSAAVMDTPGSQVYHVRLKDGASVVEHATTDNHRSEVCADLGYHPSDLLQCNAIVWVEGPSDRIYLLHWLRQLAPDLIEGTHFSIMFYGGRLASHLTFEVEEKALSDFIALRRLNRRSAIVIDSDRNAAKKHLNETKRRLQKEFDSDSGIAWITDGREIENYWPASALRSAIAVVVPSSTPLSSFGRYENCLAIRTKGGKLAQAPKVDVARWLIANHPPAFDRFALGRQLHRLIGFIRQSNPGQSSAPSRSAA